MQRTREREGSPIPAAESEDFFTILSLATNLLGHNVPLKSGKSEFVEMHHHATLQEFRSFFNRDSPATLMTMGAVRKQHLDFKLYSSH